MSRSAADSRRWRRWRRSGPFSGWLLALAGQRSRRSLARARRADRQFRAHPPHAALAASPPGVLAAVGEQLLPGQSGEGRRGAARPQRQCPPGRHDQAGRLLPRGRGARPAVGPRGQVRARGVGARRGGDARSAAPRDRLRARRPGAAARRLPGGDLGDRFRVRAPAGFDRAAPSSPPTSSSGCSPCCWLAAALFVLVEVATKGSAVIADLHRALARRMPSASATLCVGLVLLWPLALPSGPLWLLLYWSALLWGYGSRSERWATVVVWLLAGFAPWIAAVEQQRVALALSPPMRALANLSEGRLYGGLFADLQVLTGGHRQRSGGRRADRRREPDARPVGRGPADLPQGAGERAAERPGAAESRRLSLPQGRLRGRQRLLPARGAVGASPCRGVLRPLPELLRDLPVRRVAQGPRPGQGDRRRTGRPLGPHAELGSRADLQRRAGAA